MKHVSKRETGVGRLFPALLYSLNLLLWMLAGLLAGAWEFLWLVVWPLPPLILYWWRTREAFDEP